MRFIVAVGGVVVLLMPAPQMNYIASILKINLVSTKLYICCIISVLCMSRALSGGTMYKHIDIATKMTYISIKV